MRLVVDAITATYAREDDDWSVKVAGVGRELRARAPGIIAARDRADQLVEKLAGEGANPTVVHLLDGSALEFTTAYMTARLARPEPAAEGEQEPGETPAPAGEPGDGDAAAAAAAAGRRKAAAKPAVPKKDLTAKRAAAS